MTQNFLRIPSSFSTTVDPGVPRRYTFLANNDGLSTALTALRSFAPEQSPQLCVLVTCGPFGDAQLPSEMVVVPICNLQGAGTNPYRFNQPLPDVQVVEFGADGGTFVCFADYACDDLHGATALMLATPVSGWLCVRHLDDAGSLVNEGNYGLVRVFINDCTVVAPIQQQPDPTPQQTQPYQLTVAPIGLNISMTDTRVDHGKAVAAGVAGLVVGFVLANH